MNHDYDSQKRLDNVKTLSVTRLWKSFRRFECYPDQPDVLGQNDFLLLLIL